MVYVDIWSHITLFYPPSFPKFDFIKACVKRWGDETKGKESPVSLTRQLLNGFKIHKSLFVCVKLHFQTLLGFHLEQLCVCWSDSVWVDSNDE